MDTCKSCSYEKGRIQVENFYNCDELDGLIVDWPNKYIKTRLSIKSESQQDV